MLLESEASISRLVDENETLIHAVVSGGNHTIEEGHARTVKLLRSHGRCRLRMMEHCVS
jgi:hypothetical protein